MTPAVSQKKSTILAALAIPLSIPNQVKSSPLLLCRLSLAVANRPLSPQLASVPQIVRGCELYPVTRILARLPRCMGMLAKILARSCQDLTKATMIMQDHGKADHASYQAYQDFPCILPSVPRFSMYLTKRTKIFHVSYQAFPCVLPSIPRFFYPSCQSNQDFFMHFSVIRTRYLNRSGNS